MFIPIKRQIALYSLVYIINFNILQTNSYAIDQSQSGSNSLLQQKPQTPQILRDPQLTSDVLPRRQPEPMGRLDSRRPIWNIAHMVNSIKELDYRLGKGANAIEVDVTFSRYGYPLYTYHGPPCDCLRHCHQQEDFGEYLRYVREIAIDEPDGLGKNLSLLFLDLKLDPLDHLGKERAGIELAKSISSNLFVDTPINSNNFSKLKLILSINHVNDVELVNNFLRHLELNNSTRLLSRIAFDVGMNDDLQQIETMWKRFGNTLNLWQGDGFTNCFSPFYNLERLSKSLLKRDQETGYPRKVYQWTIDLHDRMREALKMGVDALMTNHPERLLKVLSEPEMAHNYRLATREDDPFKRIIFKASQRNNELARHQRSASQTSGGFLGSLMDVINSFLAYIREIPFLSLPTTSRLIPKTKRISSSSTPAANTQAEYRASENISTTGISIATTTTTDTSITTTTALDLDNNSTSTVDDKATTLSERVDQVEKPLYEGPKWYTSLASNFLVSLMKVVIPSALDS